MKKGLVIIGVILLIIGLIMMLLLWPMVGTIDDEEATEKIAKGEKGTYTVVFEIDDDDYEGIKLIKGNKTLDPDGMYDNVDGAGTYVTTMEIKDDGVEYSKLQKVPTLGGILGLVLLIIGVLLLVVGLVTGRAAPMPPEQPPMEQPPMEPPMQGPPPP